MCTFIQTLLWKISLNYDFNTRERLTTCLSIIKCWDGNKQNLSHCYHLSLFLCFCHNNNENSCPLQKREVHAGHSPPHHHPWSQQLPIFHIAINILKTDHKCRDTIATYLSPVNMCFLFLELYFNDVMRHCSFEVWTLSTETATMHHLTKYSSL